MIGTAALTSFDSFNSFILKGDAAQGLGYLFDSLMTRALDEPDAVYGLVAHSARVAPDRSSVTFRLRPEAKFADGSALTADDVVFTFDILKEKGHPAYRVQLKDVTKAEALDPHTVRFTFTGHGDARSAAGGGEPADPVQGLLRHARVRPDNARPAAGLRPLRDRRLQAGRLSSATGAARTIGPRTCPSTAAASTSTSCATNTIATARPSSRASRPAPTICARSSPRATGPRPTTSPPSRKAACSASRCPTTAPPVRKASSSIRAGRSSPTRACARRSTMPSTTSGPTRTSSTGSTRAPRASSRTPT